MSPLSTTAVFPPDWQAHHAPVAEGRMTATCELHDPSQPPVDVYDPETMQTTSTPAPAAWTGPCAVQALAAGRTGMVDAAGETVTSPPYLVGLPVAAPTTVDEGWVVKVTANPDDTGLVGRRLTVRQVVYGTQRFQRDLFCEDQ